MAFYIKKNDTSPTMRATLKDGNDVIVNLTGCSVRFHMRSVGEDTAKIDAAATLVNATGGVCQYQWATSDTDTLGSFEGEFEVTFQGGEIESFPNNKFIQIEITDDIA